MSMCRIISCVIGRGCLLWLVCSLCKTLMAFAIQATPGTPRPNLPVTPGIPWLPTFAFQPPIMKRTSLLVLVLGGLIGFHRTIQPQLLQHYWLGHRLELLWYWMVCLGKEHSVIFKTAPKNYILDSSLDLWGYSISSKGFLLTVLDIMVIWIKFSHSCPF